MCRGRKFVAVKLGTQKRRGEARRGGKGRPTFNPCQARHRTTTNDRPQGRRTSHPGDLNERRVVAPWQSPFLFFPIPVFLTYARFPLTESMPELR